MSNQSDRHLTFHVGAHSIRADCFPEPFAWHTFGHELSAQLTAVLECPDPLNPPPKLLQQLGARLHSMILSPILIDNPDAAPDIIFSFEHTAQPLSTEPGHVTHELETLADEAIEADDTGRALKLIQNAMAHFRKTDEPLGVARCTIRGAELLLEGGRYHETAFEWLTNGLQAYSDELSVNAINPHNALWTARALIGLSRLCDFDGRPLDAWDTINNHNINIPNIPASVRGALLNHMANLASKLNRPDDAISLLRDAISSLRHTTDIALLSEAHSTLGQALLDNQDLTGATVHLEEALHLAINNNDSELISELSHSLAEVAYNLNDLEAAWTFSTQAVTAAAVDQDDGLDPRLFSLLLKIAAAHNELPVDIDPFILQAQALISKEDLPINDLLDLNTHLLAIAYNFHVISIAQPLLDSLSSRDPSSFADTQDLEPITENLLGFAELTEADPDSTLLSRGAFQIASALAEAAQLHQFSLIALTGLSRSSVEIGLLDDALSYLESALKIAETSQFDPASILAFRASLLRTDGQFDLAIGDLRDSLKHRHLHGASSEIIGHTLIAIAEISLDLAEIAFTEQTLKHPQRAFDASARGAILLASADLRVAIADAGRSLREAAEYLTAPVLQQTPSYLFSLGRLNTLHSDTEAALDPFHKASLIFQESQPEAAVDCTCRLAESLLFLQKPTEAYQSINVAWQLADASKSPLALTLYLRTTARIAFMIGDKDKVISLLTQALTSARKLDDPFLNRVMHLEANLLVILRQSPEYNP